MKKIVIALICLLAAAPSFAQSIMDEEMQSLVKIVLSLREDSEASYNAAVSALTADLKWTSMNETDDQIQPSECSRYVKIPRFRLNLILQNIDSKRKPSSSYSDMLSGTDDRYNYSLYERSVKANATVRYVLPERSGRQVLVIVPYGATSAMKASVEFEGHTYHFLKGENNILFASLPAPSGSWNGVLNLQISGGSSNEAFVIINHNTREL